MSPDQFLGYELGTKFTYHHLAVDYFKYVADKSPFALYREYGKTYEGRTLGVCIVSDEENLSNLEEYSRNNLIRAGLLEGKSTGRQLPVIWLGYNIHGNESAGMETAMKTLFTLVTESYKGSEEWLKNCIIIIDPCQNPDGRELYTTRYRSSQNLEVNADGDSWEHNQTWPGARTNHYMFDLNRDWAWQTQAETRQRIELFYQLMPQVFADFHEMGDESTFFFGPGANPWHEVTTPWQHEFHRLMGLGNAGMFDEKSKLYFTKENFDLFAPGYGDTWPLFNGSIGFTFEQGGGGHAGIALKTESGDTITLKKRIDGHFTASMAAIKVSYENRKRLIDEFNRFFEDNAEKPSFEYKSVIIKGSNDKSNLCSLLQLLKENRIRYSYPENTGKKFMGFDYMANTENDFTVEKGDILISAYQPQSRLVQVLFEPDSKSADSLSYDLSAWALPYAMNLNAYAVKDRIKAGEDITENPESNSDNHVSDGYAYAVNFTGFNELKFIAALVKKGLKARYSLKPFSINGNSFERGSFVITRGDNINLSGKLDSIVNDEARKSQIKIFTLKTGLVDSGKDLGSDYSPLIKKKNVAILCSKEESSATGELWYFFERELEYPVTLINPGNLRNIDLEGYDVILLPSGNYSALKDTITGFLKKGGRVVAFERAVSLFASDKNTALFKAVELHSNELKATAKKEKSDDPSLLKKFEDERRYSLSERSAGSIYRISLDPSNPYVFGLGNKWFLLKRNSGYPFLDKGNNIGFILDNDPVAGFAGYKFRKQIKNTLVIGSENIGSGEVIYLTDDPYFRGFWKSGRVILGNLILR